MTSLAALATELEVASPEEADIEKAAKAALRRLAEQGDIWLLVYDNVASPEEIADLLPAAGARALITSRFSDWSGWADEVSLDVLPIAEAIAFLMDRAGRSGRSGRADAGGGVGAAAAGARPCGGYLQADANELRRLCGEGVEPHRRGAARRALSAQRRRDLRSRDRRRGSAMSGGRSPHGVSCVLRAGAHPLDPRRGRDRRRDRAHGGARRACRTVARQARPVRGRRAGGDRASPRSGRRPREVGGERRGAERLDAPDRTACGGLSGRRLRQPGLMATLRAAHAACPCGLRDGNG